MFGSTTQTIYFDTSKKEQFSLTNGLKILSQKLKSKWRLLSWKDDISMLSLTPGQVYIIPGPCEKFSAGEIKAIAQFLESGGNLIVLLGEGGENKYDTNINFLLEEYGIMVNSDSVIRTSYFKYFHPKEVLITGGLLNREITKASLSLHHSNDGNELTMNLLYPFGSTVSIRKPAIPIVSTGNASYPLNRPVCAFAKAGKGKIAVLGSVAFISDNYIEKEDNFLLLEIILEWLTGNSININQIDADDPDVSDYYYLPYTCKLANRVYFSLQECDEVPRDFTRLYNHSLYTLDSSVLPNVLEAYKEFQIKHEPLQLISPQFEAPLPSLNAAVFLPELNESAPPLLELYDLDDHFSSPRIRLAQLTNKCTDTDLDYFIHEAAKILGVDDKVSSQERTSKLYLELILSQLMEFKLSSIDEQY
ncbi:hypothetical protein LOD99_2121 [Oopsacas minuta]|uniref:Uncharacterized protein n=1 Tax=Oopsacas minuta TaxID=111878 RepID=A0AAV7K355_9METZ|nr:hypothetical protein LOD99_2121 [Oopsacas minuta]